ncbi:permease prefix domain 1-containing protein [Paenibacillus hamazuiensis]|uniref:permease prefix domain 1-containing protein n=1 Tax=Paenibacillus hamazuiensis TaxID=2936508 RepID=UPI00200E14D6|nr:permease prefix domain 1-containing protein [Paenibacillus hamazuiensis]
MGAVETYLNRILKYSCLTRREQTDWKEEMRSHIECSIEELVSKGKEYTEAERLTLRSFGDPRMLRNHLTRETYGLSAGHIFFLALSLFLIFCCSYIPSILVGHGSPLSPSLPMTGFIGTLLLLKTRKRMDRIGLGAAVIPFGLIYLLYKLHIPWAEEMHLTITWVNSSSFDRAAFHVFMTLLFLLGLGIFLLTRNVWISSMPLILMTVYAVLPLIKRFTHFLYFQVVGAEDWERYNLYIVFAYLESIAIRLFVLACFVVIARFLLQMNFTSRIRAHG